MKLRFVEGGGWDSKIIRWDTRCRWSHVEAFWDPYTVGAMLNGGVKKRTLDDSSYFRATAYQVVEIAADPAAERIFWNFIWSQVGRPYDWRAIASFGLGSRDWALDDSWFCSELQVRALQLAGILNLPLDIPVCRITPRDVWLLLAGKWSAVPKGLMLASAHPQVTFGMVQKAA